MDKRCVYQIKSAASELRKRANFNENPIIKRHKKVSGEDIKSALYGLLMGAKDALISWPLLLEKANQLAVGLQSNYVPSVVHFYFLK